MYKEQLAQAHTEDMQWKRDLDYFEEAVGAMRKILQEISSKNTSKELNILVSHYENQFTIQKDIIDTLRYDINLREDQITASVKQNPTAYEHRSLEFHHELKGQMIVFAKLFTELKRSFSHFVSEKL